MKVLIVTYHRLPLWIAPPWFVERLRKAFPDIEFEFRPTFDNLAEHISDAEVVVTGNLREDQFLAAKKLRWIHSTAAAVHQFMFPALVNSDVILTNARSVHGAVVAEHGLALVMACAKRLRSSAVWQSKRTWSQDELLKEHPWPREVSGATLGLLGVGSIGRELARKAGALGMRVIAVREHKERGVDWLPPDSPERGHHAVYGPDELDRMLGEADYVVIAAPVTESTEHLFNRERLLKMKSDAYIINLARGTLIDEKALVEVLRERRIAGAALDVFEHEPLPSDSPLWDLENVLITPHSAGISEKMWERHYQLFAYDLGRYLRHEPLKGLVDKKLGY